MHSMRFPRLAYGLGVMGGFSTVASARPQLFAAQADAGVRDAASASASMKSSVDRSTNTNLVAYVTDVEGNINYWNRYKQMSSVLSEDKQVPGKLVLKDGCQLVYGGDAVDRGDGDMRILRDLMQLKRAYPTRVHFILGNRDLNKLRLFSELQDDILSKSPQVYWIKDAQDGDETTGDPAERLKWILRRTMGAPDAFEHRRKELRLLKLPYSDTDVVQSFVELSCPAVVRDASKSPMASSWGSVDWVLPGDLRGLLVDYIRAGSLSLVVGDTLFVHGACHERNVGTGGEFGMHPFHRAKYGRDGVSFFEELKGFVVDSGDVRYDLGVLNRVKDLEVQDYNLQSYAKHTLGRGYTWAKHGSYDDPQDGSRLLQYGMGWFNSGVANKTVVYANYVYKDILTGQVGLRPPGREMVEKLQKGGIRRVVVGHQPNGDCPLVLVSGPGTNEQGWARGSNEGDDGKARVGAGAVDFEIIMGDTSYAANTKWEAGKDGKAPSSAVSAQKAYGCALTRVAADEKSTRGSAVSEVLIRLDERAASGASACTVHGVLSDGSTYVYDSPLSAVPASPASRVGQPYGPDGWRVKAVVGDAHASDAGAAAFLVSKTDGYSVTNKFVPVTVTLPSK